MSPRWLWLAIGGLVAVALAVVVVARWPDSDGESTQPPPTTPTTVPPDQVVVGAGDIADCNSPGDEATAKLVAARPDAAVVTFGDNAYNSGTADEFAQCYDPTWGTAKERTRPAPGNHEYQTPDATGYYDYFGSAAGEPGKGYYSYDLGAWHVVVLNSNCSVVSCAAGDPQEQWLQSDLEDHPADCTLAYWHHPRFSSSVRGPSTDVAPLFEALYDADADLVLEGHEHQYERFAPLDPSGKVDEKRGIRSIVVGTGGRSHYPFGTPVPGSEARNGDTYGIIELTLRPDSYEWSFIPEPSKTFTDSGSTDCH